MMPPPGVLSEEQCSEEELVFDRTIMRSTLIEDYGLLCQWSGLRWLSLSVRYHYHHRTIYNSVYMLGMLFGSYIFGWISDTYGR